MDDDSYLPLPTDPGKRKDEQGDNPAAELIRQKVEAAYATEPSAAAEAHEAQELSTAERSKHQKFIYELATSKKSVEDIQVAWHDYYAGLPDTEKHKVWQEFYAAQAASSNQQPKADERPQLFIATDTLPAPAKSVSGSPSDMREQVLKLVRRKTRRAKASPFRSMVFGLAIGSITIFFTLFSFFNERLIAPFIQPSRSLSNFPLISDTAVSAEPEIIVPKINVQIPVVYGVKSIDEATIQKALQNGVLHYADTALPGQNGNTVIVGHSSNNIFNKGQYKFAFVLLSRLEPGDTFYLQKDGKRYTYEVYQKKIVKPNDISVLGTADKPATASLITCDPPGTSINRLVVVGEQISPDTSSNQPGSTDNSLATQSKVIPSNAQSLWARLWSTLAR